MQNHFNRGLLDKTQSSAGAYDLGLRQYMLGIYNYMALGLALTGVVAFLVSTSPVMLNAIFGTGLKYVVMFAPLGFVFFLGFRIQSLSVPAAQLTFWAFAITMGLSLSSIFLMYTGTSIARTFFVTAGTFAGMSLYGYTTQRDLTAFGSFLFMGLVGIILASLVNLFVQSTALEFVVSLLGVLIFTGLTAYDTQTIKGLYETNQDHESLARQSIMAALQLYLDFINLFMHLLRFLGTRKD